LQLTEGADRARCAVDWQLQVGPGIFAVFDFQKTDVPLIGCELTGVQEGKDGLLALMLRTPPFHLHPALLLNAYLGWATGTF